MPTAPRRPQAHHKRQQLQTRRLRAAELFAAGVHPAAVARQLGVSRQAASTWHAAWKTGSSSALQSRGPTGPTPRLSDEELARVEQALLQGATTHGFEASCGPWSASPR
jgi:transposase